MRRALRLILVGTMAMASAILEMGEALAASAGPTAKLSQQVAGGGVTVAATLLEIQGDVTAIKVVLDTHSANLDVYKFEAIASLRDDAGKTYPVATVEQASGGGHHRQAVLRFSKVSPGTKTIELTVKDVAGVKERIFRWNVAE